MRSRKTAAPFVEYTEWHLRKRGEVEQLGIPSMQVFLHKRDFYLMSFDRNADEMSVFEEWTEYEHKDHLKLISDVLRNEREFIEIPLCPDDCNPTEWLEEKAKEHGITIHAC